MLTYHLMHKDTLCGTFLYDQTTDRIVDYHDLGTGDSPFLGACDSAKFKKWWDMRAIPASRLAVRDMLAQSGCTNTGQYLAKNLALSMTDAYWIRPEGTLPGYSDVKLSGFAKFHGGKIPYHNATTYDPNASLGGQMDKYWDLSGETPVLVKESYRFYGQQSVNEAFASELHRRQDAQIPYVAYAISRTEDMGMISQCDSFTSDKVEFISAYEVVESQKPRNDVSPFDHYVETCVSHGISRERIQAFMDYQTLTDFVISNTDEHLANFGVLRDAGTMALLGAAPIFDSGNSMFYSDTARAPYTRAEILNQKITGFYEKEEQMLSRVKDRRIVKIDLLPSVREVKDFYAGNGIPEWKANVISKNYETKVQLLDAFQHGKKISYYLEQHQ